MIRKYSLTLLLCLAACAAPPPQSSIDLREAAKSSPETTRTEQKDMNRPFLAVVNDVRDNANRCLNATIAAAASGVDGNQQTIVRYRSYTKKTSSMTAEMVLQSDRKGVEKTPSGWHPVLIADINATAADRTRVTVSGPTILYGDIFDAIFTWAAGRSRTCPSLP